MQVDTRQNVGHTHALGRELREGEYVLADRRRWVGGAADPPAATGRGVNS